MANLSLTVPDDFVPENFSVLYDSYAPFVTRLVTRYNRVQANFEDLLQHVWLKLVEVDVIHKYHESSSLPKRMTALEACSYLQMTWQSWKRSLHRHIVGEDLRLNHVRGVSKDLRTRLLRRDHGICSHCGRDMCAFERSFEQLRKDKSRASAFKRILTQLNLSPKQRNFWYAEKVDGVIKRGMNELDRYRTTCFLCLRFNSPPVTRSKSEWAPTPIEGTWASKKAIFSREAIERFRLEREAKGRVSEETCPKKVKSKPFFKLYLARAVHNIYANWCRTRSRRYKEHFPGTDPETGRTWEDTLVSHNSTQDILFELHEAVQILMDNNSDVMTKTHEEVIILLAKGCSPEDIVARLGLPRRGLKTLSLGV